MTLNKSQDKVVRSNAPTLATRHKWTPATAVEETTPVLTHADSVGNVQHGSLGLKTSHPALSKAAAPGSQGSEQVHSHQNCIRHCRAKQPVPVDEEE